MKLNNLDTQRAFEYENGFFALANDRRFGKLIAHYNLYSKIIDLPGDIVECGVFKGNSFFEFAHFRNLLETQASRKIVGFDIFGKFPETFYEKDKEKREEFIAEAGNGIMLSEMHNILRYKNIHNYELIEGDINYTVPKYCEENPQLKIALLHIDTDIYEPAVTILQNMYDKVVRGGVIMFDDYSIFPGETKAVDEFIKDKKIKLQKLNFLNKPTFIIKE
ncbi:dTDP-6-deoxy-L-hexose 3-O-methyltransferase [Campylobacter jejuni]|nr:dTDP-6-deoxy-L-hexose 3-O-methyltransferase [Campylobacter jejuni]